MFLLYIIVYYCRLTVQPDYMRIKLLLQVQDHICQMWLWCERYILVSSYSCSGIVSDTQGR